MEREKKKNVKRDKILFVVGSKITKMKKYEENNKLKIKIENQD